MTANDMAEIMARASVKLYEHPSSLAHGLCQMCETGRAATHKVQEVTTDARHPFTTFVCCRCFAIIMGPEAARVCELSNA